MEFVKQNFWPNSTFYILLCQIYRYYARRVHGNIGKDIEIKTPRVIVKRGEFCISKYSRYEKRLADDRTFIRIDAYPTIAPKKMKRHFGYVDIPISKLKSRENILTIKLRSIEFNNDVYTFNLPFYENGEVMWHISIVKDEIIHYLTTKKFYLFDENMEPVLKYATITTSEQCNLKCIMCGRITQDKTENLSSRFMLTPNEAQIFFDNHPHLRSVLLLGAGEPLLNKNIIEIIQIARRCMGDDAEINIGTNGMLLCAALAERLVVAGLSGIGFSIDGASAGTYEAIRTGGDFEKLINNIKYFMSLLRATNLRMHVWVNFVVQPINIHECGKFVSLCASLGIMDVRFSLMQIHDDDGLSEENMYSIYKDYGNARELLENAYSEAMCAAQNFGIKCSFEQFNFHDRQNDNISQKNVKKTKGKLYCPTVEHLGLSRDNKSIENFCCNHTFRPYRSDDVYDPYKELRIELMLDKFKGICAQCPMRHSF